MPVQLQWLNSNPDLPALRPQASPSHSSGAMGSPPTEGVR